MDFEITVFTDLHYSDKDAGYFNGTKSFAKLEKIIENTPNSDYYISLGDVCDYLDGTKLYQDAIEFMRAQGLFPYNANGIVPRTIFNLIGNHETAFVKKSELASFLPYEKGIGCCYAFKLHGVLFVAIDGSFDRQTGVDEPKIMRTSVTFTIPKHQIEWAKNELKEKVDEKTKSIVWLSHIAYKDFDSESREELVRAFTQYGLPVSIFEGHTHIERFYTETVGGKDINIYTLAPVTFDFTVPETERKSSYFYYTVKFSDGVVQSVEKYRGSCEV